MDSPVISIIMPAIRVERWRKMYFNLISMNKVPFEIICVGYNRPKFKLYPNFRFIYSKVKPAQCMEIAAREAKGELLLTYGDDFMSSPGFLPILYEQSLDVDMDNNLIKIKEYLDDFSEMPLERKFKAMFKALKEGEKQDIGKLMLIKRSVWMNLGGLDKIFHGSLYDVDLRNRFIIQGGNILFNNDVIVLEKKELGKGLWFSETGKSDLRILRKLWPPFGEGKNRSLPLELYDDKDILTVSQTVII